MIYPHALECIIFEGIENAHGKTAKFGGHSIRFDWIDDPEAKNSYAVADTETGDWHTIVKADDKKDKILSDVIDALKGDDNAAGFFLVHHVGPSGIEWRDTYNQEKRFLMANLYDLLMGHKLICRGESFAVFEHRR